MDDEDGLILCTECSEGYSGPRCEYCSEEYFGDPQAGRPCKKCDCNGNVDPNAIGQCVRMRANLNIFSSIIRTN
jgi:laminin, gamma 1